MKSFGAIVLLAGCFGWAAVAQAGVPRADARGPERIDTGTRNASSAAAAKFQPGVGRAPIIKRTPRLNRFIPRSGRVEDVRASATLVPAEHRAALRR